MPTIALFGRPNVGKSALFNALAGKDISLVFDRPGTTRDHITHDTNWNGRAITLVDTGGLGYDAEGTLDQAVFREAEMAASTADIVLWILDGREGLLPIDADLAHWLRRQSAKIIHVVNKIDTPANDTLLADFAQLGTDTLIPVSAEHRRGLNALKSHILSQLPPPAPNEQSQLGTSSRTPVRITLVGRPNVGKSSLTNTLLGTSRAIVNPTAGTTRDAIEIPLPTDLIPGHKIHLVDTAGMRARASIRDPLERDMASRTAHAINRSHIVLHLLEAATGVTIQDKKIAGLIHKAHRASLIIVNKWDLVPGAQLNKSDRQLRTEYTNSLRECLFFQTYAPVVYLSALTGEGIRDLHTAIAQVATNLATPLPTGPLNRVIHEFSTTHPSPMRGRSRFKILYASAQRQQDTAQSEESKEKPHLNKNSHKQPERLEQQDPLSTPRIIAFCNNRELLDPRWLAALEKKIRSVFPLQGVPLRWHWRDRSEKSSVKK